MKKIALLEKEDRIVLFTQSAAKMKMHPSIVEKKKIFSMKINNANKWRICIYKIT